MDRGGPNPLADMDRGVQIRGGSKSAVTPAFQYPEKPIGDPLQTQKILNEFRVNPYIGIV